MLRIMHTKGVDTTQGIAGEKRVCDAWVQTNGGREPIGLPFFGFGTFVG